MLSVAIFPCALLPFADGFAQDVDPSALSPATERFLIGNVLFTLLHKFGHVIIRDREVPLLGLEENAADTIAAVSLVRLDRRSPGKGLAEALGSAMLAQALIWKTGLESENLPEMLWAQHQLSAQRFARLVCLLYGSDPIRFRRSRRARPHERDQGGLL